MEKIKFHTLIPVFEELRGERVLVRPYRVSDAESLKEAVEESREHIRPWLPFADEHQTVEESRDWIIHTQVQWLLREALNCGVWEIASNRYLGGTGFHIRDWDIGYFEIGYWLRANAEGHGYITEAARLLTEYAFDVFKANRVEIRCDERNIRSASVARRLGFQQEARRRNDMLSPLGEIRTTLIFGMIPEDRSDAR
jgi:ribosomal-protein-serine acetyltransferase